jgi:hypothetical protein
VYRAAVLGASYEMGAGVAGHLVYENLVEDRLNATLAGERFERFELLNFSVGGYGLMQKVGLCQHRVFDFEPDAVFYMSHSNEIVQSIKHFATVVGRGAEIPEELKRMFHEADLVRSPVEQNIFRFYRFYRPFLEWGYRYIAEESRRHGALPVWIFVPLNYEEREQRKDSTIMPEERAAVARRLGFVTLSLEGVYGLEPVEDIVLNDWDGHPNHRGHRLLANKLYEVIYENRKRLGMVE